MKVINLSLLQIVNNVRGKGTEKVRGKGTEKVKSPSRKFAFHICPQMPLLQKRANFQGTYLDNFKIL